MDKNDYKWLQFLQYYNFRVTTGQRYLIQKTAKITNYIFSKDVVILTKKLKLSQLWNYKITFNHVWDKNTLKWAKKLYEHFSFDNFAILVSHLSVCIFYLFICLLNDLKINRNNNLGHY